MNKVPCGGFKLDENFLGMNENDELSLTGGGSEGKPYQQLVTDGTGTAKWEDRSAYYVKIGFDSAHKPSTCDTPYETILELLDSGFPVVAFAVDSGVCLTTSRVLFDVKNHCIQFDFVTLTGPNQIGLYSVCYNSDGSLYDPSDVS